MASLLASLPAPKHQQQPSSAALAPAVAPAGAATALTVTGGAREPPPYPRRKGFVPRRQEDFRDGAFVCREAACHKQQQRQQRRASAEVLCCSYAHAGSLPALHMDAERHDERTQQHAAAAAC